jgi:hypothetical protein
MPRQAPSRNVRPLSRGDLIQMVGAVGVRRVEDYGRNVGMGGPLTARWVAGQFAGAALQLLIGAVPVAYFHDPVGSGRAGQVYLRPKNKGR